jgi:hypothetical protein
MIIADFRRSRWEAKDQMAEVAEAAMHLPFMVAVPKVAYHYGLVILIPMIPVLCYLWRQSHNRIQEVALIMATVGVALSQIQAVALQSLLGTILPHFVPGFGLLLTMIGCTLYQLNTAGLLADPSLDMPRRDGVRTL